MLKRMTVALIATGLLTVGCLVPAGDMDATTGRRDAGSGTDTSGGQDTGSGGQCTMATIFFDQSTDICGSDQYCTVNQTFAATCTDNAAAAGGTMYGACGTNSECPVGASCFNPGTCMPFCSQTHPACPEASPGVPGLCIYGIKGGPADLYLCTDPDDCDAVANTGCPTGEGCYVASLTGNLCIPNPGTGAAGSSCSMLDDCAPGLMCVGQTLPGTCMTLCNLGSNVDCDTGETCANAGHGTYGICESAAVDAGSGTDA